jgi:hypothetical protein
MASSKTPVSETLCPLCLRPAFECKTCLFVTARKWHADITKGATITRALSMRHRPVKERYGKGARRAILDRAQSGPNAHASTLGEYRFPEWFRYEELLDEDKELFADE